MRRKLVKQGAATMMISLPSKWIKQNNLDKGDEIELEELGGNLLISSENINKKEKEISIGLNEKNKEDIKNILTHFYRRGFDKIIFNKINQETAEKIRTFTNNLLLGFEVTERDSSKCIVENISEPSDEKYEVILKKVFSIISETQDLVINDFENHSINNLAEIEEIKNQHDKFVFFCKRLLFKNKAEKENILEWELLTFLMHIEHSYYYLYKYVHEKKIKPNKEALSLLRESKDYFKLFSEAYYTGKIEFIHQIDKLKFKYQFGNCLNYIEKSSGKEGVLFCYIREIFRLIQIGASPILSKMF
ncbi:MAG: AbrB/MazE/SpoVT family DNA-binding domain-containing protein [Candidatus Pacearchaeota archaeon]|nr:AbrB/MazE/SpoVT family DNA-binding domain-containing protein [Candidatus Pacearchaeota archaeon]